MKILLLLFAALLVAGCGEKSSDSVTLPLSDADVERLLKEAVDGDTLERREGLVYQPNKSEPFSGWAKGMRDSEQLGALIQFKDGKRDGLVTMWYENGQKRLEVTYKDGKPDGLGTTWHENGQKQTEGTTKDGKQDGLATAWHENGQKQGELTWKDGEKVSEKFWNSKGEEVETREESQK